MTRESLLKDLDVRYVASNTLSLIWAIASVLVVLIIIIMMSMPIIIGYWIIANKYIWYNSIKGGYSPEKPNINELIEMKYPWLWPETIGSFFTWSLLFTIKEIINIIINIICKNLIKQQRPADTSLEDNISRYQYYGMPSTHAQVVSFWAVLFIIRMYEQSSHKIYNFVMSFIIIIIAVLIALSRYYLTYHTFNQVAIGFILGVGLGGILGFFPK